MMTRWSGPKTGNVPAERLQDAGSGDRAAQPQSHDVLRARRRARTGQLVPIEYWSGDGALVETRDNAKPLVAVYIDALPKEHEEEEGI